MAQAQQMWADYQARHDVSDRRGQTAGIDPVSGRIWFGDSIAAVSQQLEAEDVTRPLFFVRVGSDCYYSKVGKRIRPTP